MLPEDRPTVTEKYATAIESDSLEVSTERRGDVDMLIAAGWTAESLGTALYRLRTEFDSVRGELRITRAALPYWAELKADAKRNAESAVRGWRPPMAYPWAAIDEARRMQDEAEAFTVTALALILNELKTLRDTRAALGRYALKLALRVRWNAADTTVLKTAGRALEWWLDPACPRCSGRGFNGGFGTPMELCVQAPEGCGGTGKRQMRYGESNAAHLFGRELLSQMDRKCDMVDGLMRAFLSNHPKKQALVRKAAMAAGDECMTEDDAARALQRRLADLRSSQAERD